MIAENGQVRTLHLGKFSGFHVQNARAKKKSLGVPFSCLQARVQVSQPIQRCRSTNKPRRIISPSLYQRGGPSIIAQEHKRRVENRFLEGL